METLKQEIPEHYAKCFEDFKKRLRFFYDVLPENLNIFFFIDFCSKSQADKVYWHLQEFGSITNLQCHEIYGIRHAPSVIRDLRTRLRFEGDKYRIENETQKGCNRFGVASNWAVYKLVPNGGCKNELPLSA